MFCFQTFAQNTINDSIISTKKFEIKAAPIALLSSSNIFLGFDFLSIYYAFLQNGSYKVFNFCICRIEVDIKKIVQFFKTNENSTF